jgi:hypothetical protein
VGQPLVDVKDLIDKFSIAELNEAAEEGVPPWPIARGSSRSCSP